ncbi:ArsC family reductase [Erythrobacter sp.]|jgi:Spx/MgsR family transcriptional regulator|uniref:ArsC family reductase n=1 Tax=Erythrobacter sp. TaxID=1042 RepID=UPI002EBB6E2C|nr:ArsC family reductase [Erythrobacter sp.]
MIHLFGIPNCDSVRKARKWLDANDLDYAFHDYKKEGATREALERWADEVGWQVLLNNRGTTYRKLDEAARADLTRERAIDLMLQHTSLIKRPVLTREDSRRVLVGFSESEWENQLC